MRAAVNTTPLGTHGHGCVTPLAASRVAHMSHKSSLGIFAERDFSSRGLSNLVGLDYCSGLQFWVVLTVPNRNPKPNNSPNDNITLILTTILP